MKSLLLTTLSRGLFWVLLLLSLYLLFRGHNEPGGGFIGGLVAAAAYTLATKGMGEERAQALLRVNPLSLLIVGLCFALGSGCLAILQHQPYMTGQWLQNLPIALSSLMLFDMGVFFVVLGGTLTFLFSLENAEG